MEVIAVTGSVGTGKTALSGKLAGMLNYRHIDANKIIRKYGLSEGYDAKRKTRIIGANKLNRALIREIGSLKKNKNILGVVIDSHLSHYLPAKYVNLCIVTKSGLGILNKRLKKRKYSQDKIRENLDAEIFDVCLNEARDNKHNILIIDTSRGISNKAIASIEKLIGGH